MKSKENVQLRTKGLKRNRIEASWKTEIFKSNCHTVEFCELSSAGMESNFEQCENSEFLGACRDMCTKDSYWNQTSLSILQIGKFTFSYKRIGHRIKFSKSCLSKFRCFKYKNSRSSKRQHK